MEDLGFGFDGGGGGVPIPWLESSSIRRRRLSSPSPSAFLAPAFDACASITPHSSSSTGGSSSSGSLDFDASLLRYTRSGSHFSSSDSSDLASLATRRRLQRLLQSRSSLSSFPPPSSRAWSSSISPLSPVENILPARSPPMYMTPVKLEVGKDVVVMDGVLVSDAGSNGGRAHYRTEVCCRTWVENGICRFGSKCQFAHGKEDLHVGRSTKYKSELSARISSRSRSPFYSLPSTIDPAFLQKTADPASYEDTNSNVTHPVAETFMTMEADCKKLDIDTLMTVEADCKKLDIPCLPPPRSVDRQWIQDLEPAEVEAVGIASEVAPCSMTDLSAATYFEQMVNNFLSSPRSIEPSSQWPLTEDHYAQNQITEILYGPSQHRRLPVFTELFTEHAEESSSCNIEEYDC